MRLHAVPAGFGAAGSGRHQGRHARRPELVSAGGRHFRRQRPTLASHEPGSPPIRGVPARKGLRAIGLMGAFFRPVIGAGIFLVLIGWLAPMARGAGRVWPSPTWTKAEDPAVLGWSMEKLAKAEDYSRAYSPTAVIIVQDGKVIASWGDVGHKANIRSMRKSLFSALYGIGVAEGRISLNRTIGELGIDDRAPSLSDTEKQATVRDLLIGPLGHLPRCRL